MCPEWDETKRLCRKHDPQKRLLERLKIAVLGNCISNPFSVLYKQTRSFLRIGPYIRTAGDEYLVMFSLIPLIFWCVRGLSFSLLFSFFESPGRGEERKGRYRGRGTGFYGFVSEILRECGFMVPCLFLVLGLVQFVFEGFRLKMV